MDQRRRATLSVRNCITSSAAIPRFTASALFRLRERDFDEVIHAGGISPAWPLKYRDFAPYYDAAEALFHVHGARGEDPTEPPTARPYPYPAGETRAQDRRAVRQADRHRSQAVPSAARHSARPEGGRLRHADQHLHALHRVRRLSLSSERQGGRTGDLHRPDAREARQRDADDQRLRLEARRRMRAGGGSMRFMSSANGQHGDLFGRHGGGRMRSAFLRAAPAALGQRPASKRPRQRLRSGRAQLYAPRDERRHGGDAPRQRDGVPEDPGVQRFLFRQRRLELSPRPDPDVRDQPRRSDQGRGTARLARVVARHAVQRDRPPFDGFLAAVRRPAASRTTASITRMARCISIWRQPTRRRSSD